MTVVPNFRTFLILIAAVVPDFIGTRVIRLMRNKRASIRLEDHPIPEARRMRDLIDLTIVKNQIIINDSVIMLREIQIPRRQVISAIRHISFIRGQIRKIEVNIIVIIPVTAAENFIIPTLQNRTTQVPIMHPVYSSRMQNRIYKAIGFRDAQVLLVRVLPGVADARLVFVINHIDVIVLHINRAYFILRVFFKA